MSKPSSNEFRGTKRFQVRRRLGEGGMGVVYEVLDRKSDSIVALKTLLHVSASGIFRLKREFRALADVSHPNLVELYELVAAAGQLFFTMELVDGVNWIAYVANVQGRLMLSGGNRLRQVFSSKEVTTRTADAGPLSSDPTDEIKSVDRSIEASQPASSVRSADWVAPDMDRLRHALTQLVDGVAALHHAGKLHRDLKPSNVLVTKSDRVVLLDFGLASDRVPGMIERSLQEGVVGTPMYMSPEQAAGKGVTPATDWYSLGTMLYQALTGRLPFTGNVRQILRDKQRMDPAAPRELVPEVPESLNRLCMKLLRRDPASRANDTAIRRWLYRDVNTRDYPVRQPMASRPPVGKTPFVGRDSHLEALRRAFDATELGRPVIVWVHGVSGFGKSELIYHFLQDLKARSPVVTLSGRCYEQESVPYKALDSCIDALSAYLSLLPEEAVKALLPRDITALVRLFPVLHRVGIIAKAHDDTAEMPDKQRLRQRAFAALEELFGRMSAHQPLVLAIDDLQWGDADSGMLLYELLSSPKAPAILMIGSYRSDEAERSPLLRLLRRRPELSASQMNVSELAVGPLSEREATELAALIFDSEGAEPSPRCAEIARESRGSPFFVRELVRYSMDLAADAASGERQHNVTLERVLRARLDRLSPELRKLLEVVATAGRPIDRAIAVTAAAVSPDEQRAIAALRAGNWLRVRSGFHETQLLEVYHDRIREVVMAGLDDDTRRRYHGALAIAMEASNSADLECLALHFSQVGNMAKAAHYMEAAATEAERALAFDHAARLYRLALDMEVPSSGDSIQRRSGLLIGLGRVLANAGRGPEAARAYLAALEDPNVESVELRRRAATQFLLSGYFDEGIVVLQTVLDAAGLSLAKTPRRALASLLWRRFLVRLRGLRFTERAEAEVPAAQLEQVAIYWTISSTLGMVDPIRGNDFQARHLLMSLRVGEPYRLTRAVSMEAAFSATAGYPSRHRTAKLVARAYELADRCSHPQALAMARLSRSVASFCIGEWRDSLACIEESIAILRDRCTGVAWELTTGLNFQLGALFYTGQLGKLRDVVLHELKGAQERGDLYLASVLRTSFGEQAWLVDDQLDVAREQVELGIGRWTQRSFQMQHYWALRALCYTDLYAGEGPLARGRLLDSWPALRRSLLLRVQVIRIQMIHLRAKTALAAALQSSAPDQLLRHAARDARALAREKVPWSQPVAIQVQAGIAALRGDAESAVAYLASAEDAFATLDMSVYAAAARVRRGQLIGGDLGKSLMAEGSEQIEANGVRSVERMISMLTPGFVA